MQITNLFKKAGSTKTKETKEGTTDRLKPAPAVISIKALSTFGESTKSSFVFRRLRLKFVLRMSIRTTGVITLEAKEDKTAPFGAAEIWCRPQFFL